MNLTNVFASSDVENSLGNQFRRKRFADFKKQLEKLPTPLRILDIGGLESFWVNNGFGNDARYHITLLNLDQRQVHHDNIISVAGDACNLSAYTNQAFDISFSNSVIEHVYTFEKQVQMAKEIQRVGKFYYVQTPNKHFFIEPHYIFPFFQYLPRAIRYFILTKTPLSRGKLWKSSDAKQYIDEIRLLSLREMKRLFPGSHIYKEKFWGMIKSFTFHNFPD